MLRSIVLRGKRELESNNFFFGFSRALDVVSLPPSLSRLRSMEELFPLGEMTHSRIV